MLIPRPRASNPLRLFCDVCRSVSLSLPSSVPSSWQASPKSRSSLAGTLPVGTLSAIGPSLTNQDASRRRSTFGKLLASAPASRDISPIHDEQGPNIDHEDNFEADISVSKVVRQIRQMRQYASSEKARAAARLHVSPSVMSPGDRQGPHESLPLASKSSDTRSTDGFTDSRLMPSMKELSLAATPAHGVPKPKLLDRIVYAILMWLTNADAEIRTQSSVEATKPGLFREGSQL